MYRGVLCAFTALACWVSVLGTGLAQAQNPPPRDDPPPPRQDRRDDRKDDRQDRRDDRQDRRDANPGQPPAVQGQPRTEVRVGEAQPQARRAKSVIGSKISIEGNLAIGTVDDIIFSDDGYIDYLVVLNEGKYVLVPWQAAKFNFEQKTATVSITQTQFRQVPTFTVQTFPNVYAPGYQEQIYRFYNIRPGQDRRLDRRDRRP